MTTFHRSNQHLEVYNQQLTKCDKNSNARVAMGVFNTLKFPPTKSEIKRQDVD
jgi:hypothetical protein